MGGIDNENSQYIVLQAKVMGSWLLILAVAGNLRYPWIFSTVTSPLIATVLLTMTVAFLVTLLVIITFIAVLILFYCGKWLWEDLLSQGNYKQFFKNVRANRMNCYLLLVMFSMVFVANVASAAAVTVTPVDYTGEQAMGNHVLEQLKTDNLFINGSLVAKTGLVAGSYLPVAWLNDGDSSSGDGWKDTLNGLELLNSTGELYLLDLPLSQVSSRTTITDPSVTTLSASLVEPLTIGEAITNWIISRRLTERGYGTVEKITTVQLDNGSYSETVTREEEPVDTAIWWWSSNHGENIDALRMLELAGALNEAILGEVENRTREAITRGGGFDWAAGSERWEQTYQAAIRAQELGYFDLLAGTPKITQQSLDAAGKPYYELGELLTNQTLDMTLYPGETCEGEVVLGEQGSLVINLSPYTLSALFGVKSDLLLPEVSLTFAINETGLPNHEDLDHALTTGLASEEVIQKVENVTERGEIKQVVTNSTVINWNEQFLKYRIHLYLQEKDGEQRIVKEFNDLVPRDSLAYSLPTWELDELESSNHILRGTIAQVLSAVEMTFDGKKAWLPYSGEEDELLYSEIDNYTVLVDTENGTVMVADLSELKDYLNATEGINDWESAEEFDYFLDEFTSQLAGIPLTEFPYRYVEEQVITLDGWQHVVSFKDPMIPFEQSINLTITAPPVAFTEFTREETGGDLIYIIGSSYPYLSPARIVSWPVEIEKSWKEIWQENKAAEGWVFSGLGQLHVHEPGSYFSLVIPSGDERELFTDTVSEKTASSIVMQRHTVKENINHAWPVYEFRGLFNSSLLFEVDEETNTSDFRTDFDYIGYFNNYIKAVERISEGLPAGALVNVNNIVNVLAGLKNATTGLYDGSVSQTVKTWKVLDKLGLWMELTPSHEVDTIYRVVMDELAVETSVVLGKTSYTQTLAFKEQEKGKPNLKGSREAVEFFAMKTEHERRTALDDWLVPKAAVIKQNGLVYVRDGDGYVPLVLVIEGQLLDAKNAAEIEEKIDNPLLLEQETGTVITEKMVNYGVLEERQLTIKDFERLLMEKDMYWLPEEKPVSIFDVLEPLFVVTSLLAAATVMVFRSTDGLFFKLSAMFWSGVFILQVSVIPLTAGTGMAQPLEYYLKVERYTELLEDIVYELSATADGIFVKAGTMDTVRLQYVSVMQRWGFTRDEFVLRDIDRTVTVEESYGEYVKEFYTGNEEPLPQMTLTALENDEMKTPVPYLEYVSNVLAYETDQYVQEKKQEIKDSYQLELERTIKQKNGLLARLAYTTFTTRYDYSKASRMLRQLDEIEAAFGSSSNILKHLEAQKQSNLLDALSTTAKGEKISWALPQMDFEVENWLKTVKLDVADPITTGSRSSKVTLEKFTFNENGLSSTLQVHLDKDLYRLNYLFSYGENSDDLITIYTQAIQKAHAYLPEETYQNYSRSAHLGTPKEVIYNQISNDDMNIAALASNNGMTFILKREGSGSLTKQDFEKAFRKVADTIKDSSSKSSLTKHFKTLCTTDPVLDYKPHQVYFNILISRGEAIGTLDISKQEVDLTFDLLEDYYGYIFNHNSILTGVSSAYTPSQLFTHLINRFRNNIQLETGITSAYKGLGEFPNPVGISKIYDFMYSRIPLKSHTIFDRLLGAAGISEQDVLTKIVSKSDDVDEIHYRELWRLANIPEAKRILGNISRLGEQTRDTVKSLNLPLSDGRSLHFINLGDQTPDTIITLVDDTTLPINGGYLDDQVIGRLMTTFSHRTSEKLLSNGYSTPVDVLGITIKADNITHSAGIDSEVMLGIYDTSLKAKVQSKRVQNPTRSLGPFCNFKPEHDLNKILAPSIPEMIGLELFPGTQVIPNSKFGDWLFIARPKGSKGEYKVITIENTESLMFVFDNTNQSHLLGMNQFKPANTGEDLALGTIRNEGIDHINDLMKNPEIKFGEFGLSNTETKLYYEPFYNAIKSNNITKVDSYTGIFKETRIASSKSFNPNNIHIEHTDLVNLDYYLFDNNTLTGTGLLDELHTIGKELGLSEDDISLALGKMFDQYKGSLNAFAQALLDGKTGVVFRVNSPLVPDYLSSLLWSTTFEPYLDSFSYQEKIEYLEANIFGSEKGYEKLLLGGQGYVAGDAGDASFSMIVPPYHGLQAAYLNSPSYLGDLNSLFDHLGAIDSSYDNVIHSVISGTSEQRYYAGDENDSKGIILATSLDGLPDSADPVWRLQNWLDDGLPSIQRATATEEGFHRLFGQPVNLADYPNASWTWRCLPESNDLTGYSQDIVRKFDDDSLDRQWNELEWSQGQIIFKVRNTLTGTVKTVGIMATPNKLTTRNGLWAVPVDGKYYIDPVTYIDDKWIYNEEGDGLIRMSRWASDYVPEKINLYGLARDTFAGAGEQLGDLEVISFSLASGQMADGASLTGYYKQSLLFTGLQFDNGVEGPNAYSQAAVKVFYDHHGSSFEGEFTDIKSGDQTWEDYFVSEARKLATGAADGNSEMIGANNARDWFVQAKRSDSHDEFRHFMAIGAVMVWDDGPDSTLGTEDDILKGIICEKYDFPDDNELLNAPAWTVLPGEEAKPPVALYYDPVYDNGWDDPDLWLLAAKEIEAGMLAAGYPAYLATAGDLVEFMAQAEPSGMVVLLGAVPDKIWGCYDPDTKEADSQMAADHSLLETFMERGGTVLSGGQHGALTQVCFAPDDTHGGYWLGNYVDGNNPGGITGIPGSYLLSDSASIHWQEDSVVANFMEASGTANWPSTVTDYYSEGIPEVFSNSNIIHEIDSFFSVTIDRGDYIIRVPEPTGDGYEEQHVRAGMYINYHTGWDDASKAAVNWGNLEGFAEDIVALLTGVPDSSETWIYSDKSWLHSNDSQVDSYYIDQTFTSGVSGWTGLGTAVTKNGDQVAPMTANSATYAGISLNGKNVSSYPVAGLNYYLPISASEYNSGDNYSEKTNWTVDGTYPFNSQGPGPEWIEGSYSFKMVAEHDTGTGPLVFRSDNSITTISAGPTTWLHFAINPWEIQSGNWGTLEPYWTADVTAVDAVNNTLTVTPENGSMGLADYRESDFTGKMIESVTGELATVVAVDVANSKLELTDVSGFSTDDDVMIKELAGKPEARFPGEWYLQLTVEDGSGTDKHLRYYFTVEPEAYYDDSPWSAVAGVTDRYYDTTGSTWLLRSNTSNPEDTVDNHVRWISIPVSPGYDANADGDFADTDLGDYHGEWSSVDQNILADYNALFGAARTRITVKQVNFRYTGVTMEATAGRSDTIMVDDLAFYSVASDDYYLKTAMTDGKNKYEVYSGMSWDGSLTIEGEKRYGGDSWQKTGGTWCVAEVMILPLTMDRMSDELDRYSWFPLVTSPAGALAALEDVLDIEYSQLVYTEDLAVNGVAGNTWIDDMFVLSAGGDMLDGGCYIGTADSLSLYLEDTAGGHVYRSLDTPYLRDYDTLEFDVLAEPSNISSYLEVAVQKNGTSDLYGIRLTGPESAMYADWNGYGDGSWHHVNIDLRENMERNGITLGGENDQVNQLRFVVNAGRYWIDNVVISGPEGILMTDNFEETGRSAGYTGYSYTGVPDGWTNGGVATVKVTAPLPAAGCPKTYLASSLETVDLVNETVMTVSAEGTGGSTLTVYGCAFKEDGSYSSKETLATLTLDGWGNPVIETVDLSVFRVSEKRSIAFIETSGTDRYAVNYIQAASNSTGESGNPATGVLNSDYLVTGTAINNGVLLADDFDHGNSLPAEGWTVDGSTLETSTDRFSSGKQSMKFTSPPTGITPEHYWPVDEGSFPVQDAAGSIDSTYNSGAAWTTDNGRNVLYFTNDYVDFGNISSSASLYDSAAGDLTFAYWIKPVSGGSYTYIISTGGESGSGCGIGAVIQKSDNKMWIGASASTKGASSGYSIQLTNNQWTHVVAAYDYDEGTYGTLHVYIDGGVANGGSTYSYPGASRNNVTDSWHNLCLGRSNVTTTAYKLYGYVKEIAFFDSVLGESDAGTLCNEGIDGLAGGSGVLKASKHFDSAGAKSVISYSVNFASSETVKLHVSNDTVGGDATVYSENGALKFSSAQVDTVIEPSLNLDQWYKVRLELNTGEGTVDLYLDGTHEGTHAVNSFDPQYFVIEGSNAEVYLDDLLVYKDDVTLFNGTEESYSQEGWTASGGTWRLAARDTAHDPDELELYLPMDSVYYDPMNPRYSQYVKEVIYDQSSNGSQVTSAGDSHYDEQEGSWYFDGNGDGLTVDSNLGTLNEWTASAWVKVDNWGPGWMDIMTCTGNVYPLLVNAATKKAGIWDDVYSTTSLDAGKWYSITTTRDSSGNGNVYINGRLENTAASSKIINGDITIGMNPFGSSEYWNGWIKAVEIWSFAKTPEQVWVDYAGQVLELDGAIFSSRSFPAGSAEAWTIKSTINDLVLSSTGYLLQVDMDTSTDFGMEVSPSTTSGMVTVTFKHGTTAVASKEVYLPGYSSQVLCLPLNEGTGAVVTDLSPYGNNGILINDPAWDGDGLGFNGSNQHVDCGSGVGSALAGAAGVTFSGWFKLDTVTSDDGLFTVRSTGDGDWFWNIRPDGTAFRTGYKTSGGASYRDMSNPFAGEAGKWVHLATTYSSGHLKTYKNGVLIDDYTGATGDVSITTGAVTYIGSYGDPGSPYKTDGYIKAFQIFNRELSKGEISSLASDFLAAIPEPAGPWTVTVTRGQAGTTWYELSGSSLYGSDKGLESSFTATKETGESNQVLKQIKIGKDTTTVSDVTIEAIDPILYSNQGNNGEGYSLTVTAHTGIEKLLTTNDGDSIVLSGVLDTDGEFICATTTLTEATSTSNYLYMDVFVDTPDDMVTSINLQGTGSTSSASVYFNGNSPVHYQSGQWYTLGISIDSFESGNELTGLDISFTAGTGATGEEVSLKIRRFWIAYGPDGGMLGDGISSSLAGSNFAAFKGQDGAYTVVHSGTDANYTDSYISIDMDYQLTDKTVISFDWYFEYLSGSDGRFISSGVELETESEHLYFDVAKQYGTFGKVIGDVDGDQRPDKVEEWVHFETTIKSSFNSAVSGIAIANIKVYLNDEGENTPFTFKVRNVELVERAVDNSTLMLNRQSEKHCTNFHIDKFIASPRYPLYGVSEPSSGSSNLQNAAMNNLVVNPGFEEGLSCWSFYNTFNSQKCDWIENHSGNYGLRFKGLLEPGGIAHIGTARSETSYVGDSVFKLSGRAKFSFWAKSDSGLIDVSLDLNGGAVSHVFYPDLTSDWQYFEYFVDCTGVYETSVAFSTLDEIWIDDVYLEFTGELVGDGAEKDHYSFRSFDPLRVSSSISHAQLAFLDGWYETSDFDPVSGYVDPSDASSNFDVPWDTVQYFYTGLWVQQPKAIEEWILDVNYITENYVTTLWVNGQLVETANGAGNYIHCRLRNGYNSVLIKKAIVRPSTIVQPNDYDRLRVSVFSTNGWYNRSITVLTPKQAQARMPLVYHDPQYSSYWISRSSDPAHDNLEDSTGASYTKQRKLLLDVPLDEGEGFSAMERAFTGEAPAAGTIDGNSTWDGEGLYFDQSGDRVRFDDVSSSLIDNPGNSDLSFSFWVHPEGTGYRYVLATGAESGSGAGIAAVIDPAGYMWVGITSTTKGAWSGYTVPMPNGKWTHVTAVYDIDDGTYGTLHVYKNGELFNSYPGVQRSAVDDYHALKIGEWSGSGYNFKGHVKDIKAWNQALAASEVAQVLLGTHRDAVEDNVKLLADGITANLLAAGLPGMVGNSQRLKWYMDVEVNMYYSDVNVTETVWHPFGSVLMTTDVLPETVYEDPLSSASTTEKFLEQGGKLVWSTGYVPFSIKTSKAEAIGDDDFLTGLNGEENYGYKGAAGHQQVFDIEDSNVAIGDRNGGESGDGQHDYYYGMFIYDENDPDNVQRTPVTKYRAGQEGTVTSVDDTSANYTVIYCSNVYDYQQGKAIYNKGTVLNSKHETGYIIEACGTYYKVSKGMDWQTGDEFLVGGYWLSNENLFAATAGIKKLFFDYEPYMTSFAAYSQVPWTGLKAHGVMGKHEYTTEISENGNELTVYDVTGERSSVDGYNEQNEFRNDLCIDPADAGMWFQPFLLDSTITQDINPLITDTGDRGEWFQYVNSGGGPDVWYYHHERYNLGTGSVQAGRRAKGIVSYLPLFNWNEEAPDYSQNAYNAMPLTGTSYKRLPDSVNSDFTGRYSDRGTGGLLNTPVSRQQARSEFSMAIGAMVVATMVTNNQVNACADNSTQDVNLLPGLGNKNVYASDGTGAELYLNDTTTTITGQDYHRYPLFTGSYQKLLFENGDYLYEQFSIPLEEGNEPEIQDLVGFNDSLATWIATEYSSVDSQFLSLEGLKFDGSPGATDNAEKPDLYATFYTQKENALSNAKYGTTISNTSEGTGYAVGVTDATKATVDSGSPWEEFPGDVNGQTGYAYPVEFTVDSPWGEDTWGTASGRGHELVLRQYGFRANSKTEYESQSWYTVPDPNAPPSDFSQFYRDFNTEQQGWLKHGYFNYPVDSSGNQETRYIWGASMPWSKVNPAAKKLFYSEDFPLFSSPSGWSASSSSQLTFSVTCPDWSGGSLAFTFSPDKTVDTVVTSLTSGAAEWYRKPGDSWGTAVFSPYGTGYECAPLDVLGSPGIISGHQTIGAIAVQSISQFDFTSPDYYMAHATQWLASDTTGSTYSDTSGLTLSSSAKDIGAIIITPAMNCYYKPYDGAGTQQLLVNSPKAVWVELFTGNPTTNDPVFRQKYLLQRYQTSDLFVKFDEAVKDISYMRIWVDSVYDETYRNGSTPGSGTAGTSNMGGFAQIMVIEDANDDYIETWIPTDLEESIRYGSLENELLFDSGYYNWNSEPNTAGTIVTDYGVRQTAHPNKSKRYDVHVVTTVSHTSAMMSGDDIANWREFKSAMSEFDMMMLALVLQLLLVAGCITIGAILSWSGGWLLAIGAFLDLMGLIGLLVNAPMIGGMVLNFLSDGKLVSSETLLALDCESHVRNWLTDWFGPFGFYAYYFIYDLDYTACRFTLTAIQPEFAPFLWAEKDIELWNTYASFPG